MFKLTEAYLAWYDSNPLRNHSYVPYWWDDTCNGINHLHGVMLQREHYAVSRGVPSIFD